MTVAVDEDTVREFVTIISEHADELAKSNGKSGVLQLTRLSPIDGKLVPSRFKLDDIDGMVRAAVADANAKHNVYIEGRTVRSDLRGRRARAHSPTPNSYSGWLSTPTVTRARRAQSRFVRA